MTPTQLKDWVKNKSKDKNMDPQTIMRMYLLENFAEKVSKSKYNDKFVFKGGFIVSSRVGVEKRTTLDVDTSIRNQQFTQEKLLI